MLALRKQDEISRKSHVIMRTAALVLFASVSSAHAWAPARVLPGPARIAKPLVNANAPVPLAAQSAASRTRTSAARAISTSPAAASASTATHALIMANILIFVADKVARMPLQYLYLVHRQVAWWQPLTACFCHASRSHLSGNLFLLLLFGRSVEDDLGWGGILLAYAFCGIVANLVSLVVLPAATVSLGASGAVFGLFAVSILTRLSWRDLDWRKVVEVAVLGDFVFDRVLSEIRTAATGGIAGVNHVAHLSGAAAGVAMVLALRGSIAKMESGPAGPKSPRIA